MRKNCLLAFLLLLSGGLFGQDNPLIDVVIQNYYNFPLTIEYYERGKSGERVFLGSGPSQYEVQGPGVLRIETDKLQPGKYYTLAATDGKKTTVEFGPIWIPDDLSRQSKKTKIEWNTGGSYISNPELTSLYYFIKDEEGERGKSYNPEEKVENVAIRKIASSARPGYIGFVFGSGLNGDLARISLNRIEAGKQEPVKLNYQNFIRRRGGDETILFIAWPGKLKISGTYEITLDNLWTHEGTAIPTKKFRFTTSGYYDLEPADDITIQLLGGKLNIEWEKALLSDDDKLWWFNPRLRGGEGDWDRPPRSNLPLQPNGKYTYIAPAWGETISRFKIVSSRGGDTAESVFYAVAEDIRDKIEHKETSTTKNLSISITPPPEDRDRILRIELQKKQENGQFASAFVFSDVTGYGYIDSSPMIPGKTENYRLNIMARDGIVSNAPSIQVLDFEVKRPSEEEISATILAELREFEQKFADQRGQTVWKTSNLEQNYTNFTTRRDSLRKLYAEYRGLSYSAAILDDSGDFERKLKAGPEYQRLHTSIEDSYAACEKNLLASLFAAALEDPNLKWETNNLPRTNATIQNWIDALEGDEWYEKLKSEDEIENPRLWVSLEYRMYRFAVGNRYGLTFGLGAGQTSRYDVVIDADITIAPPIIPVFFGISAEYCYAFGILERNDGWRASLIAGPYWYFDEDRNFMLYGFVGAGGQQLRIQKERPSDISKADADNLIFSVGAGTRLWGWLNAEYSIITDRKRSFVEPRYLVGVRLGSD
jgi:hypothetical protein